jgi:hypothetical protein
MKFGNKFYLRGFLNGQQQCAKDSREIDTTRFTKIISEASPFYTPPEAAAERELYNQGFRDAVLRRRVSLCTETKTA